MGHQILGQEADDQSPESNHNRKIKALIEKYEEQIKKLNINYQQNLNDLMKEIDSLKTENITLKSKLQEISDPFHYNRNLSSLNLIKSPKKNLDFDKSLI